MVFDSKMFWQTAITSVVQSTRSASLVPVLTRAVCVTSLAMVRKLSFVSVAYRGKKSLSKRCGMLSAWQGKRITPRSHHTARW